jgi:hypothetical protein
MDQQWSKELGESDPRELYKASDVVADIVSRRLEWLEHVIRSYARVARISVESRVEG